MYCERMHCCSAYGAFPPQSDPLALEIRTCEHHCQDTKSRDVCLTVFSEVNMDPGMHLFIYLLGLDHGGELAPEENMTGWQIRGVKFLTLGHRVKNTENIYHARLDS